MVFKARFVQRFANRGDLTVLRGGRRDDVGARFRGLHRLNAEVLDGEVVVDGVALQDAAVTVAGVLAETDVRNHHQLRGGFLDDAHHARHHAVFL